MGIHGAGQTLTRTYNTLSVGHITCISLPTLQNNFQSGKCYSLGKFLGMIYRNFD